MRTLLIGILSIVLLSSVAFAQDTTEEYKLHPGYIDFGSFENFENSPKTVEISIKGPLLKFVSKAVAHEDPDFSKLLDGLLLIQVNVFGVGEQQVGDVAGIIQSTSKALATKQWERMMRVQDEEQHVEIYTQFGDTGSLTGLVVMALGEDNEAAFVNIVGTLDPEQLGKLSAKFNIPMLDNLNLNEEPKNDDTHNE
jgi:hypothetical protein